MTNKKSGIDKTFYAILIGINDYDRKTHRSSPLSGCINDVIAISDYFEKLCHAQQVQVNWKPLLLLAPREEDMELLQEKGLSLGNSEDLIYAKSNYYHASRENIIKAFGHFKGASAKNGDFCLLYYSGHGSYISTSKVEVFSDYEPSGELQTIICADRPRRDLLDKELGYLIAKTMEGKEPNSRESQIQEGVHFLSIMDCCHSGSNTRNEGLKFIPKRGQKSSNTFNHPTKDILGFTEDGNCFYSPFEQHQERVKPYFGLKHARYIGLAASRDTESAYELELTNDNGKEVVHGIFTNTLIKVLEKNGVTMSYKELIDRVKMEVRNWIENQVPVLSKTDDHDENLRFLTSNFTTPKRQYLVSHRREPIEEWWMNAGAIHGIVPSAPNGQQTIVKVSDSEGSFNANITQVRMTESILEGPFKDKHLKSINLQALIEKMAFLSVRIGLGKSLSSQMQEAIRKTWKKATLNYAVLAKKNQDYLFEINSVENSDSSSSYILTRAHGDKSTPLFARNADPNLFLVDLEKVARFHSVISMENPDLDKRINENDVKIEILKMEGVPFDRSNLRRIDKKYKYASHNMTEEVILRYKKVGQAYVQPAIKVRISSPNNAELTVGALYCNHAYQIRSSYIPPTQIGGRYQSEVELAYPVGKERYPALPLTVPDELFETGITEVTDYLLLFVSQNKEFDLSQYDQEGVKFDVVQKYRTANKTSKEGFGGAEGNEELKKGKWTTILIPIRVIRPQHEIVITGGSKSSNNNGIAQAGFTIIPPPGFQAIVQPTTLASVHRKARFLQQIQQTPNSLIFPSSLWSGLVTCDTVFNHSLATSSDNYLRVLELQPFKKAETLNLSPGLPLDIVPNDPVENDETIVPVAYDEANDIYLPVGYTSYDGNVLINDLPDPTSSIIGADGFKTEAETKSVGGSVKLFFQKIAWSKLSGRHEYDKLTLIQPNGQSLRKIEYTGRGEREKNLIIEELNQVNGKEILLLTHGITGDTEDMIEAIFSRTSLHQQFGAVLAFDYENLYSEIQDTAKKLNKMLGDCGVQGKRLTVVSHSMGGLMARSWIEQHDGDTLVRKLIQLGTPNGGSQIADFRKKLFGWLTLALNGLEFAEKHKPLLAFFSRMVGNPLFRTLRQMSPDSDFILNLNNPDFKPDVPYYLIAGDTTEIEAIFDNEDPIWKKLKACFRDRSKYIFADYLLGNEPNDMAVKLESMKALPWDFTGIEYPKCDHLRYFHNESALAALKNVMG